jgi:hypothetical protein
MGIMFDLGTGQGIPSGYTVFGREKVEKAISGIFAHSPCGVDEKG